MSDSESHYDTLGVPRDSTDKQINAAYKMLSLKYHPERNPNDEVSAAKFKAVHEAFQVLSDAQLRKDYDSNEGRVENLGEQAVTPAIVLNENETPSNEESSGLGGIQKALGGIINVSTNLISRFSAPANHQIAQELLEAAEAICRNGGIEGGGPPLDQRVTDLAWGWGFDGKVERQSGAFFRLTVDNHHAENGFIVHCRSNNKSKFKLIMFDVTGTVLYQDDSSREKDRGFTYATLFFTSFDVFQIGESCLTQDKQIPPLFNKLESFAPCKHAVAAGQYLLCVYGENFIGKANYNIVAVPSKNDCSEVNALEEIDDNLVELKGTIANLKGEYLQTKAAYDAVLERIKQDTEKVDNLIQSREKQYIGFLDKSISVFNPNDALVAQANSNQSSDNETTPNNDSSNAGPNLTHAFDFLKSNTITAASHAATAASTVSSTATGWITKRLSFGLPSMGANKASTTPEQKGEVQNDNVVTADSNNGSFEQPVNADSKDPVESVIN